MKTNTNHHFGLIVGLGAVLALTPKASADYPSMVAGMNPVAYYRLGTTNPVPTEVPAVNAGSLGAAVDGEYQSMAASRGLPGAIAGDADTSVSIVGATGQQVVVPFSADYNPNGPFTVECWAKPDNTDAGNRAIAISMVNGQNPGNADDRSGWCLRQSAGDWQMLMGFDYSDGATYYGTQLNAPGTASAEAWQHVVAVYDGAAVSLYVNGVLAATSPLGQPMLPNHAAPLILGDRGYTGWDYNGLVDEFAIYTSALSAAEIQAHYDNGVNAARTKPYPDLVKEKNPALYLRLGEVSLELPVALNSGSYGAAANGVYLSGTTPGLPGPQMPGVTGFETTNVAAGFNGLGGSVQIPGLELNADTVTMVCWLKRDGVQPARAGIMHNRKVSAPEVKATGLGFQDDGLALSYNWEDLGTSYTFNPGFVPPDQAWTFYAVTVSPSEAVMYMGTANGFVAATNTIEHIPHDFSGTTVELGWDNYQATRIFRGALDEFAIFDKVLDYDQVAGLYQAALPAILSITRAPADPVYEGMTATFGTSVAGLTTAAYQWRKAGAPLAGRTEATLTLDNVVLADSGDYDVVVTQGAVTLTSPVASLDVQAAPPTIVQGPASAVRFVNGTVEFRSTISGSQPLTFQWKRGEEILGGATSASLVLSDLQPADAGEYTVVVTNPLGNAQASATLTLVTPEKFAAAALNAGPIGYWRLDETTGTVAYDYWGGRDGVVIAGATNNVAGPRPTPFAGFDASNTAYDLNGGGGRVEVPALNVNKAAITMVAWIKPNGTPDDYDGLVFSRGGGTVAGLDYQTGGQLGYHWNDTAETYNWASGLYPVDGQWNFVALVVTPTLGTVYLDDGTGLQSAENAVTHGAEEFNGTLRFGADSDTGRFYKGTIDEVVIYDRALSSAEITALRNAGVTGTFTPAPPVIVEQPRSETIMVGSSYTLSVKVTGSVPLSYQWQKNGLDLPGAVRSSLAFASAAEADTGSYQLVVTQGATKLTSAPATLTVKPVPAYLNATQDLVVHLKFDGNYQDASGRNNHGTVQGSPQIVTGKIGSGALKYDTVVEGGAVTTANYVTLGQPVDLKFGPQADLSVAFWIKFTGSPGDLPFLANNEGSVGGPGVTLAPSYKEGGWSWGLNDVEPKPWPGVGLYDPVKNTINDGQWHHLVHVFDRTADGTTYLDGVKVNAFSIVTAADWNLDSGFPWNIGQASGTYPEAGTFEMDDLGIWRRTLNRYEAESIYVVGNLGRSFDTEGPAEVKITFQVTGGNLVLGWTSGTLESADEVTGSWSPVTGASAPSHPVTPNAARKFYRVKL